MRGTLHETVSMFSKKKRRETRVVNQNVTAKNTKLRNARRLKRAFMTYIETLAVCNLQELSHFDARVSCPFLEARGNLEDASTALSAHSRVRLQDAERLYRMSRLGLIAAIPGKGLTNGLLLRRSVWRSRGRMKCLTSNKRLFFSPTVRGDMRNGLQSLHTLKHATRKKNRLWILLGQTGWTVIDVIESKLSGSFIRVLSDWCQVDYGDFV